MWRCWKVPEGRCLESRTGVACVVSRKWSFHFLVYSAGSQQSAVPYSRNPPQGPACGEAAHTNCECRVSEHMLAQTYKCLTAALRGMKRCSSVHLTGTKSLRPRINVRAWWRGGAEGTEGAQLQAGVEGGDGSHGARESVSRAQPRCRGS